LFYFFGASTLFVDGGEGNYYYIASALLYPILSILGMLFVELKYKNKERKSFSVNKGGLKYIYIFVALILLGYTSTLETIPLFYLLSGDSLGASIARSLVTKEYEGPKIFYYFFRVIVDYVLIFIVVNEFYRKKKITLRLLIIVFISVFVAILDTQKYPAVNILLMLFLAIYTHRNIFLKFKSGLSVFVNLKVISAVLVAYLAIGLLWGIGSGRIFDKPLPEQVSVVMDSANSMVGDRLLFGQNRMLYATYEIIPYKYDYFYGRTLPNPLRILPYEPVVLSYLTFDEVHPEMIGGNIRGSGPVVFYSTIYANFGIVASFAAMFAFGMFMQFVNNKLVSNDRYLIAYRFIWLNYITLFSLSFDPIYNSERFYFIMLIYVVLFVKFKPGFLRRKTSEN
jgi:hypothetical protein